MKITKSLIPAAALLIIAAVFTTAAEAQILPKFGVKGGLNYSTLNNMDDAEYKAGFSAGVFADIAIPATPVSVQPELLYTTYGAGFENTDLKMNLSYLQIPVLVKFGFPTPVANPHVFFGPYMGFLLKADVKADDFSMDIKDETKSTDFGVAVGAGIDIKKFTVGLRYTAGLTNIDDPESGSAEDFKNGAFGLTVGIRF